MKKQLITICLMGTAFLAGAQSDVDALRYSTPGFGYTARGWSTGGAFGAIGADLAGMNINPAGMAQYKTSAFTLSFGTISSKASSEYLGNTIRDNMYNMNLPSIGLVFTNRKYKDNKPAKSGWINTNIGLSINRSGEFNRVINYGATNSSTSMLDYWAERANGWTVADIRGRDEEFNSGFYDIEPMFWEGYLIDSVGDRQYAAAISDAYRNIGQKNVITTSGRMYDYTLSMSGNFNNILYLGGDIHVTSVRYTENNSFREYDDPAGANVWNTYEFERELNTSGTGVGGRLGMIIRPGEVVRFGLAYQTPTIFTLNDIYQDHLRSSLDDGRNFAFSTLEGEFTYNVTTPARTTASAAFFAGKKGFVSADLELIDYGTMRLSSTDYDFEYENEVIADKYKPTVNLRLGGEYVLNQLRFRAGYANYGSPFRSDGNQKYYNREFYTAGIGIFERDWSLDLALVHERQKDITQPYVLTNREVDYATNTLGNNRMIVTLSTRF